MIARVNLTKAINTTLAPELTKRGFSMRDGTKDASRWSEGRFFRRERNGREDILLIGRDKYGGALAFTVVRERQDGSSAYMDWHNRGLTRERLRYGDQDELNELLMFLVRYFDEHVAPWLAST